MCLLSRSPVQDVFQNKFLAYLAINLGGTQPVLFFLITWVNRLIDHATAGTNRVSKTSKFCCDVGAFRYIDVSGFDILQLSFWQPNWYVLWHCRYWVAHYVIFCSWETLVIFSMQSTSLAGANPTHSSNWWEFTIAIWVRLLNRIVCLLYFDIRNRRLILFHF